MTKKLIIPDTIPKVKCKICGNEYYVIQSQHLKKHNISMAEYLEKFPDAKLLSDEYRRWQTENSPNRGLKRSAETKEKLSKTKKQQYADGIIVPSNKGRVLSKECKKK